MVKYIYIGQEEEILFRDCVDNDLEKEVDAGLLLRLEIETDGYLLKVSTSSLDHHEWEE